MLIQTQKKKTIENNILPFKYLDLTQEDISSSKGAIHTSKDIAGQPSLWEEALNMSLEKKQNLQKFFGPVLI